MNKTLLALVLFAAQHGAFADASYWVSVGSFQDSAVAERVVGEASNALNETFSVQRTETASGVVQRVATGPFDSRDDAQVALDHAKAGGYPDSWIFSRADEANMAQLNDDPDAGAIQRQPTLQDALKQVKELPTEIPPGYRLNQLYRDGQPPNAQQ